jgi:hypothetical protein
MFPEFVGIVNYGRDILGSVVCFICGIYVRILIPCFEAP